MSFHLELSLFGFRGSLPQQLGRPQNGQRDFFQKLHFEINVFQQKKIRCVTAFWSTFSLNLSIEEV